MAAKKSATAEELDKIFDEAIEDITDSLDLDKGVRRVSIDFPLWMIAALDEAATRLAIPRQAVVKTWLDDELTRRGFLKGKQSAEPWPGQA